MSRIGIYFMTAMLSFLCISVQAQKRNKKKPVVVKSEPTAQQLLYDNMLESTQQVFFIDSIVVDKENILNHIPLPKECGSLMTYDQFFGTTGHENSYVYVNEFGNKNYYSLADTTGNARLYTMDKLGSNWTKGVPVEGINQSDPANFPFMMPDGTTLYFSQQGEGSVGGYDIFVTRYDAEEGRFFRPENIGLPFNSTGNDYLYIVDEIDELGWFVTDRRQPEGKVCVYTFVPSKTRKNLNLEELEDEDIQRFAAINSIRETWPSEKARNTALKRLQRLKERSLASNKASDNKNGILFVVNDQITYTSLDSFRSSTARDMYIELLQSKERYDADVEQLDALRDRYADASDTERNSLKPTILEAERELETLEINMKTKEKSIRNAENMSLTK